MFARSIFRHAVRSFEGAHPRIHETAFVAPTADVIGKVRIGKDSSIWYNCVLRGDVNTISIGERTNIQDGTIIHVRSGEKLSGSNPNETKIGDDVTIGHAAIIHACTLEDRSFIGMQACIMDFAVVESEAMIGAGALVTPRTVVKSGELWAGRPAKKLRDLREDERKNIQDSATGYVTFGLRHKEGSNYLSGDHEDRAATKIEY